MMRDQRYDPNDRVPASQALNPKFKPQAHQKKLMSLEKT
jgi:hypothetical protein